MTRIMHMVLSCIMTQSRCERSPGSRDECRTAPGGCQPLDQGRRISETVQDMTKVTINDYNKK